jgi:transposase
VWSPRRGEIERPAADRPKTDQRDAERVLRLLMIDGLHAVRVPSAEEEALRDVVRAREAVRGDLMRARQRLSQLLLRHDIRYEDTASAWTVRHRAWLGKIDLGQRGAQVTLLEYLGAIDAIVIRRDALEKAIGELIPDSPWARTVTRLRFLRGIDTLSAVGLCAEIGDFERFQRAGQLMSYVGLVPSENTSGAKRRQGAITKTGTRHARRLLVQAAWRYRRAPAKGQTLRRRQDGQPAPIIEIAWQDQRRLHRVWQRRDTQRGKRGTIRRGRRRPRALRLLLGARRLTRIHAPRRLKRRQTPGPSRDSIRDLIMRSPHRPRSILDSRAPTTKTGPGATRSAHESLTARRAPVSPAAPPADKDARPCAGVRCLNP